MDQFVIKNKLESLRRCIKRIETKRPTNSEILKEDIDLQDIISVNLERAVQVCIDIACHIISDFEEQTPATMAESFIALEKAGVLNRELANRMVKAVGFRNTAVHAYQEIDWDIVYSICDKNLEDFKNFAKAIIEFLK